MLAVRNRAIDGKGLSPSRFAVLPAATGAFTSRLSTGRSPFPLLDMTTTATGPPCIGLFLSRSFRKHNPSFFRRFFVRSETVSSSRPATVASRRAQELSRLVASSATTRRAALTVPSTAAPSNAVGARSARRRLEGSSRSSADLSRHNLVCGGSKDPNHDAVIRIGCEAPKRRGPILCYGVISHGVHRATATSNRHRRPVTSGRGGPKLLGAFCVSSLRGAQNDAVRHDTLPHEPPQGDQKLTRQGHDHSLATAAGVLGASSEPLRQGAVLLEHEKSPRQLDHAPPNPGIAGPRQPLLAALLPALVGRAS